MKKKIKILQLVPLGTGGITNLILNINEYLDRDRFEFDYLTFYDRKEFYEDRALKYGGKKYVVPLDRFDNQVVRALFKFFYAVKVIRECGPDIIHINASTPYDMLVGVSAKIAGTGKIVIHSHNSSMKRRNWGQQLVMKGCRILIPMVSDCNLACSELAARYMFTKGIIAKKKYTVIHNGIDVQKYRFSPEIRKMYRKKLQAEENYIVGHVGRFSSAKNHKKLIEIFERFSGSCPEARLLLIGIGELEAEIREMVRRKGIMEKVIFYGATAEVPQFLQAMDCFVFPSLYEGLPIAAIEAQAAGLPVFMSDTISKELAITSLVRYIPLDAPAEKWADEILAVKMQKVIRKDRIEETKKAGFDVEDAAEQLMRQYSSLTGIGPSLRTK